MSDLDEWRWAVNELTETERATNCEHLNQTSRYCPDCGNEIQP